MERNAEIEDLVRAWFAAASKGDPSLARRHVSAHPGTRLIGSDPNEVFQGGRAIAVFLAVEIEGAGGKAEFAATDVEAYAEGTVGWASAKLAITVPDGRQVTPRWTAVFHREDGLWKFVQTHVSIGVSNDRVGWRLAE